MTWTTETIDAELAGCSSDGSLYYSLLTALKDALAEVERLEGLLKYVDSGASAWLASRDARMKALGIADGLDRAMTLLTLYPDREEYIEELGALAEIATTSLIALDNAAAKRKEAGE